MSRSRRYEERSQRSQGRQEQSYAEEDLDDEEVALKHRVARWLAVSGMNAVIDVVVFVLGLASCALYVQETYVSGYHSNQEFDRVELIFALVLAFDYALRLFVAERRLQFLRSAYAVIDVLALFPILLTYGRDFDPDDDSQADWEYAVRGLRALRLLRLTQGFRMVAHIDSQVNKLVANIVLTVLSLAVVSAGVVHFVERDQQLEFHEWIYFIIVTISTVGYGDISPDTVQGKYLVVCMISAGLILIPKQTNELIELTSRTSVYQRRAYSPHSSDVFVLVCGSISVTSVTDLFSELFHEDHGMTDLHAVMLAPGHPSYHLELLLRDPRLALVVTYLDGSPLIDKDLARASASRAASVLVMADKLSGRPDEEDASTILQALAIRKHVAKVARRPAQCFMQLIRPENKDHIQASEDDSQQIICVNEIKMGLLAKTSLCPGLCTLVCNFVASYAGSEDDNLPEWLQEYDEGCGYEIYVSPLSACFTGVPFSEAVVAVTEQLGATMFALQLQPSDGPPRTILNPGHFPIPDVGRFQARGFLIAEDKKGADLSAIVQIGNRPPVAAAPVTPGGAPAPGHSAKVLPTATATATDEETKETKDGAPRKSHRSWNVLRGLLRQNRRDLTADASKAALAQEAQFQASYFLRPEAVELASATLKRSLELDLPGTKNHIIVCGDLTNLPLFVLPLRARHVGAVQPIVILAPEPPPLAIWSKLARFPRIAYCQGSALELAGLRRAGCHLAARAVVLAKPNASGESHVETLVDADTIFTYQAMRRVNPDLHVVVEIVNHTNTSFLRDSAGSQQPGADDYRLSPLYCSGSLFTSSIVDTLVAQAYYNPHITTVLAQLVSGTDPAMASAWDPLLHREVGDIRESHLFPMPVPKALVGKTYAEVSATLITEKQYLPIAIYRGIYRVLRQGSRGNRMPYVYANPAPDAVVDKVDVLFVLAQEPPATTEPAVLAARMLALEHGHECDVVTGLRAARRQSLIGAGAPKPRPPLSGGAAAVAAAAAAVPSAAAAAAASKASLEAAERRLVEQLDVFFSRVTESQADITRQLNELAAAPAPAEAPAPGAEAPAQRQPRASQLTIADLEREVSQAAIVS